ncbi:PAS domain-containing sensor histidine kinase [Haloarculaceae archaeon H-GB1-1]|nr:PAS domain-containing sensor histidine kinase [Haloarculaceae archaeon H-GB1-1]
MGNHTPDAHEVIQHVDVGVVVYDDETGVIEANDAFRDLTGYDGGIVGAELARLTASDRTDSVRKSVEVATTTADRVQFAWPLQHADGDVHPVDATAVGTGDGRVVVTVHTRSQYRSDSIDDFSFSHNLITAAPVPIWVQRDDEFQYCNWATADFFGVDEPTDLIGCSSMDFVVEEEKERAQNRTEEVLTERTPASALEGRIRDVDGQLKHALFAAAPLKHHQDDALLVVANDITERKEYEATLEQQSEQLQLLNRIVRHDIRNDMQLVLANAEFAEEHVDDEGAQYLDRLLSKGEHVVELTRVVGDLMTLMLSEGEPDLHAERLPPYLREIVEDVEDSYEHATVIVEGDLPNVTVRANEMLDSVVRNLVENAVQHNDTDDPTVAVSAEERVDTAAVRVADDGPGVPDDAKESIFGKGEKGLDSEGVGLGLYLVNQLVDLFGGSVHVEDRTDSFEAVEEDGDPRGAVFVVELPKF